MYRALCKTRTTVRIHEQICARVPAPWSANATGRAGAVRTSYVADPVSGTRIVRVFLGSKNTHHFERNALVQSTHGELQLPMSFTLTLPLPFDALQGRRQRRTLYRRRYSVFHGPPLGSRQVRQRPLICAGYYGHRGGKKHCATAFLLQRALANTLVGSTTGRKVRPTEFTKKSSGNLQTKFWCA